MTEAQKVTLEAKCIMIDSAHYPNVTYAIDRNGKGMWLIVDNKELPILRDQVETFLQEALDTWRVMRKENAA